MNNCQDCLVSMSREAEFTSYDFSTQREIKIIWSTAAPCSDLDPEGSQSRNMGKLLLIKKK